MAVADQDMEIMEKEGPEEESNSGEESHKNPWPNLEDLFAFKHKKGNNIIMQCKMCLPRRTELSAYKTSTSNLRKHVVRKHPSKLADFSACAQKSPQEQGGKSKQSKLPDNQAKLAVGGAIHVSQGTVDWVLIRLICEGQYPFSLVEQPAFKEFAAVLNPQYKVLSRPTVKNRIAEAAAEMKTKMISHLSNINHVATTTDCWSAHQKSYIGVTCHWIDGETFERRSVVLACKRLRGSHTFDVLAGVLDDIHCQYRIRGKVVRTTTDSGSNFVKAFSIFGEQSQSEDEHAGSDTDQEGSESDDDVEFQDTFSILEQDNGLEYQLPKHQRCACHLLNLAATTDADIAEKKNNTYKRLSRAAFGKCQALWNKSGRLHTAAEVVEDKCGLQLIRPNKTRWNSTYMAVERIIRIIKEQGEDAIRCVCEELKLKMLSQAEIAFLDEFCCVMRSVVKALNILQSESNTHLGWLLPVISELQSKLRRQEASVKMCLPLISALQQGVHKRFGGMMEDRELISAAILLPKFKTGWTDKAEVIEAGLLYLRHHLDQMAEAEVEQGALRQHSSDEEDFSTMKSRRSEGSGELEGYLACVSESMDLLNSFPNIKKLSLKLNTGFPASAACERLFSSAGLLFTAKRARLTATNFENQLLLKLNKNFAGLKL